MRNQQVIFGLLSLFIVRLIAFSGTYVDAICIVALIGYKLGLAYLENKKVANQVLVKVEESEKLNAQKMQQLADEMMRVKNASEGLRAAINLTSKK
jgi:hypothetical protein